MIVRALLTLALTLMPAAASACAGCLSSAYGDRTFNWAHLGLLVTPFLVAAGIGSALIVRYRVLRVSRASRPSEPSPGDPRASGTSGVARLSLPSEETP